MATLTLKKKTHLGSGNFEYTYECFCSPKPSKDIVVTSGNDNEAKALAQLDCDEYCGQSLAKGAGGLQAVKLSVDELLSERSTISPSKLCAIVEASEKSPEMVKVTPWSSGIGCLCHAAIELPKAAIDYVVPTGRKHGCCGKTFPIVELHFHEGTTIPVEEVLGRVSAAAAAGMALAMRDSFRPGGQSGAQNSNNSIRSLATVNTELFKGLELRENRTSWDFIQDVTVEGSHAHIGGETCDSKRFQLSGTGFRYEWDQQVIQADHDTHWSFVAHSPQDIEWVICASNCTFSCDQMTLRIMYRVVPA